MKRYGMILADNGSSFYFQGEANPGWTEDDIEPLKDVPASAFEAVWTSRHSNRNDAGVGMARRPRAFFRGRHGQTQRSHFRSDLPDFPG